MGFEELQHTADWAVRVWGGSLEDLFVQAAAAMYALTGARRARTEHVIQSASGWGPDHESLLVVFLSELNFRLEQQDVAFDAIRIRIEPDSGGYRYEARLDGGPATIMNKAIKAVTYHNMSILRTGDGLEVQIVFDV